MEKIFYLEFGWGKKPILFLHGWQADSRSFAPLVPFLFKNYHLYLLDLPGFGKSKPPSFSFSSFEYANKVVKWIKIKKLQRINLVGHSFGGKIASIIAAKYPRYISRLILIAPSGIPHPKFYYKLKNLLPSKIKEKIFLLFKPFLVSEDYKNAGKLLPIFKTVVKEDLRPIFSKIKIPTLIIWGRKDDQLPPEDGKIIKSLIKSSKLVIMDGDHWPFLKNPKKTAQLIDKFIKDEH